METERGLRMKARAKRKTRTREQIAASASRLLREKGISGARVADVMSGAGLTVGGFYAHFASKQALIDDALRRTGAELRDRLVRDLDDKPAEDRAEVALKRYLSAAHRDGTSEGCPLPSVVGEVATTAPEHRAVVGEQVEAFASVLQDMLSPGRAVPRRTLALGLVAMMYGGLSLSRAVRGTPLSDEMLKACRALGLFAARREARRTPARG